MIALEHPAQQHTSWTPPKPLLKTMEPPRSIKPTGTRPTGPKTRYRSQTQLRKAKKIHLDVCTKETQTQMEHLNNWTTRKSHLAIKASPPNCHSRPSPIRPDHHRLATHRSVKTHDLQVTSLLRNRRQGPLWVVDAVSLLIVQLHRGAYMQVRGLVVELELVWLLPLGLGYGRTGVRWLALLQRVGVPRYATSSFSGLFLKSCSGGVSFKFLSLVFDFDGLKLWFGYFTTFRRLLCSFAGNHTDLKYHDRGR